MSSKRSLHSPYLWWGLSIVLTVVLFLIDPDAGVISAPVFLILLSWRFYRDRLWAFVPALIISVVWMVIGRNMYSGYNLFDLSIWGVSLFPALAWPTGLYLFYLLTFRFVQDQKPLRLWLTLSVTYSIVIIAAEYVGYNLVGIQLAEGTQYPGWPVLNIFHASWWMLVAYFVNGILFSAVVVVLGPKVDGRHA